MKTTRKIDSDTFNEFVDAHDEWPNKEDKERFEMYQKRMAERVARIKKKT